MKLGNKVINVSAEVNIADIVEEVYNACGYADLVEFVTAIDERAGDLDLTEKLFKRMLKIMIDDVENNTDEYVGTKWEMLPSLSALLED